MMGYGNYYGGHASTLGMGMFGAWMGMFLVPLLVWSLAWKGYALWKAAKADSKVWFVVLLLVNTMGILDILYIYVFSNQKSKEVKVLKSKKRK